MTDDEKYLLYQAYVNSLVNRASIVALAEILINGNRNKSFDEILRENLVVIADEAPEFCREEMKKHFEDAGQ